MPGRAADRGQVPFCSAAEESRAGVEDSEGGGGQERPGAREQRQDIVWRNVVLMSLLHLAAVYSLVLIPKAKPLTLLWGKSRGRPLRPADGGEAAPERAESRVSCPRCGAPSALLFAAPGAPAPLACSCPPFGTGRSFCPDIFNFSLPCGSARVGALVRSPKESGGDPESCGGAAVRGEAREGRRWAPPNSALSAGGQAARRCRLSGSQGLSYLLPFGSSVSSAGHGPWGRVKDKKGSGGGWRDLTQGQSRFRARDGRNQPSSSPLQGPSSLPPW